MSFPSSSSTDSLRYPQGVAFDGSGNMDVVAKDGCAFRKHKPQ